jgi:hypothetical protein
MGNKELLSITNTEIRASSHAVAEPGMEEEGCSACGMLKN